MTPGRMICTPVPTFTTTVSARFEARPLACSAESAQAVSAPPATTDTVERSCTCASSTGGQVAFPTTESLPTTSGS